MEPKPVTMGIAMEADLGSRRASAAIFLLALATACGGSTPGSPPAPVASVSVILTSPLGVGQSTQALAVLRDASNQVLSNRTVTWASSATGVATVSPSGMVTAVAVGSADITATSESVSRSAGLIALAAGANPTQMAAVSALGQTGTPSSSVIQAPAVLVQDATGNPVPGVMVTFIVTAGAGTVTGSPATTDANGVARVSTWVFGPAGGQAVRAASPAIAGVTVDFAGLSRPAADGFDITLQFLTPMTEAQTRAFVNARERIQEVITGDIKAAVVNFSASQLAGCGGVAVSGTIDDVLILAEVAAIDGSGNALAEAGPCVLRSAASGSFPVLGHMKFDIADIDGLGDRLETVILHEMLHVIGFGTMWGDLTLLAGGGTTDPRFLGAHATDYFGRLNNGAVYTGLPIPVEGLPAPVGTRDSHWRESVFDHELMTGYIDRNRNPLSATTIGSLEDLGYTVDPSKADPFDLANPAALRAGGLVTAEPPIFLGGDVRTEPPIRLDVDGRPVAR